MLTLNRSLMSTRMAPIFNCVPISFRALYVSFAKVSVVLEKSRLILRPKAA